MYSLVLIAVTTDLRSGKISNRLILTGLGIALIRGWLCSGIDGLVKCIFQISFPVIMLYLFFLIGALGAGDIKLFSLISGFINFKMMFVCMIASFVFGALISIILMIYRGIFLDAIKQGCEFLRGLLGGCVKSYPKEKKHKMPFSVAILGGVLVATLFT